VSEGSGTYCLDTSVIILSLRGDSAVRARLAAATLLYTSSVTLGELYYGAYSSPTRPDEATIDIEQIVATITTLNIDRVTATIYGGIKRDLKRRGLSMPDNDLWIAATAIQYDVTLAARDAHFTWIPDVDCEQW
jgi:tRNA(fMet)-specific endonuclease VapC